MEVLNLLGKAWLLASYAPLIALLVISASFTPHRAPFMRALFLSLFSILINENLKLFFQVPYALPQFHGFAFPSGHTQASVAFWGWLMYEYPGRWSFLAGSTLIAGIGYWLVYFGRHQPIEVLAAIPVGIILIDCFAFLLKKVPTLTLTNLAHVILIASIPLAITLGPTVYHRNITAIQGILFGCFLGDKLFKHQESSAYQNKKLLYMLIMTLASVVILCGLIYLFIKLCCPGLSLAHKAFLYTFATTLWLNSERVAFFIKSFF